MYIVNTFITVSAVCLQIIGLWTMAATKAHTALHDFETYVQKSTTDYDDEQAWSL